MRLLPYVRFIDQFVEDLPMQILLQQSYDIHTSMEDKTDFSTYEEAINRHNAMVREWNRQQELTDVLEDIGAFAEIGKTATRIGGAPTSFKVKINNCYCSIDDHRANCIFDLLLINYIKDALSVDLELNNSYRNSNLFDNSGDGFNVSLVEKITIKNIPNYFTVKGPYHPCIEDARNDLNLKYFRQWIISNHESFSKNDINDICRQTEETIAEMQDKLFIEWLDAKTYYKSIGETFYNVFSDLIIPQYSTVTSIIKDTRNLKKIKDFRWQGFIVNSKKYFNK